MRWDSETCAEHNRRSDGYTSRRKTGSFAKMQGLSSRAHAFSVEALVGKPCKRMKVSDESSSAADTGSETSTFTGLNEYPVSQMKKAGSSNPRRAEDTSCDPERQPVRSRAEEADPGVEESKPKESDLLPDREVRVELQGSELWKRFYEIGTEMIITKAGRRMFPSVRVKVRNLDPGQQYYIAMDVMPVDSKRYRYVYHSSQWMVAGNTDHSCISPRLYVHPDSPCAGETWMRQVISFDRVKLTNNEMDDKGHIILQSMHKYKPRVHVIRHDPRMDLSQIQSLPAEGVHSFSFPETEFTTVTAYQNQQFLVAGVCSRAGDLTPLLAAAPPVTKASAGTASSFHQGSFYDQRTYYYRNSITSCDRAHCWSPQPIKAPNKTITKLKIDRNPFAKGFRDPGRNRGVLDGLLESYPWRGPLSLDFKPFTIQLQGSSGSPTSSIKTLLPLSSSSPLQPFSVSALSCHDAALHALTLPLYGKTSTASPLPSRAFSSLGVDRLRGLPPLPDLPFLSALQPKKPLQCRDPCPGSLFPLHGPFGPHGPSLLPHLSDTAGPYCFYRYSFPLNPQLTALSRHAKLAEDTTDCLLRPSPWHPTTNHCL
ncbi:hypothetical protein NQZ68_022084 [Dissostichus eleginoides]|nr:hypothetical protein NQZ68_022084 [Dissostichus eleginoides]